MASTFCPKCGTPRVAAFRYCRSCGLDYDAIDGRGTSQAPPPSIIAPAPVAPSASLPFTPGPAPAAAVAPSATPDGASPSGAAAGSTWEERWHRWESKAGIGLLIAFAVFCVFVLLAGPQG